MDPTPRPRPSALLTGLRHLRRIALGGVVALGLLGIAVGGPAAAAGPSAHETGAGAGKVSTQRRVNGYEGRHRPTAAGDPSRWSIATGKDPGLPVPSS